MSFLNFSEMTSFDNAILILILYYLILFIVFSTLLPLITSQLSFLSFTYSFCFSFFFQYASNTLCVSLSLSYLYNISCLYNMFLSPR